MAGRGCSSLLKLVFGGFVRSVALLACLLLASCSPRRVDEPSVSKELIPAEWTVAEDTLVTGDVLTTSVQLPAAREISGLAADEPARLVLRCIDHRMKAFIDTGMVDSVTVADSTGFPADTSPRMIPIELDSAPACE
jgi:hypothetical protein